MKAAHPCSRREFLAASCSLLATTAVVLPGSAESSAEPVIDIHQHTNYADRTNEQLIRHQQVMGVTKTVLLPAGRFYGLDAKCGTNETVVSLTRQHPDRFVHFANEVADIEEAPTVIKTFLKRGAIGIGEQKFRVGSDSRFMERIAALAEEFGVPVLMHFQHAVYNTDIQHFHKTLEKFPKVNFIGHAQTWWANIDKNHQQEALYPKTPVTPGGITDRLLSDYPNMFGDCSAGSGVNALTRDEDFTSGFLERHQNKLVFGSDCEDAVGSGPKCQGAQILAAIRRFAPNKTIERKIFYENARKLLKV
jgi:predicted TIM-barrel fold metal-dependent hydrolase